MTENSLSSMYSNKALRALADTLQLHRSFIWVDPSTNTLAVKRISQHGDPPVMGGNDQVDQFSDTST